MIAPETAWPAVVQAIKAAHPYEEVAHDVISLRNTARVFGMGRVGPLTEPAAAGEFVERVKAALHFPEVRAAQGISGDKIIRTVAVCGGAGASLLGDAIMQNADAFVTSDVRHHEFVEAEARNFLLIDAGHRQTEVPGTRQLARRLQNALNDNTPVTFYD